MSDLLSDRQRALVAVACSENHMLLVNKQEQFFEIVEDVEPILEQVESRRGAYRGEFAPNVAFSRCDVQKLANMGVNILGSDKDMLRWAEKWKIENEPRFKYEHAKKYL